MIRRALFALLLLGATMPLVAGDAPARDWKRCPAVVVLKTPEVVHALGDIHGDYDRLVALLVAGKLIRAVPDSPEQVTWTGGKSVLVVTGDMIDKGTDSLDVIAFMRALAAEAESQGGRVVISAGNHEAEFLEDPSGDKTRDFRKELKAAGIKPADVADGKDSAGIGSFLRCLPFASRVNGWFFAHAGSTKGRTMTQLIDDLENGFEKDGYDAKVLLGNKGLLEARMKPPWWEKDGDKPLKSVARLLEHADALGVKHIVFGHQPGTYEFNDGTSRKKGTMFTKFDGLVFLIDTGMSRAVGHSKGALLRIEQEGGRETATAVFANGTQTRLWP